MNLTYCKSMFCIGKKKRRPNIDVSLSGVGENRTLVQTSNQKAFYALSF